MVIQIGKYYYCSWYSTGNKFRDSICLVLDIDLSKNDGYDIVQVLLTENNRISRIEWSSRGENFQREATEEEIYMLTKHIGDKYKPKYKEIEIQLW